MNAKELSTKYEMTRHAESGLFFERHYVSDEPGRAASGSICYYVAPGERTGFHRIDCDEYWCHNAGCDLEVWSFSPDGTLRKLLLGVSEAAEPFLFFKKGEVFASRLSAQSPDGAFLTCITVPRFSYEGAELIEKDAMLARFPASADFWAQE